MLKQCLKSCLKGHLNHWLKGGLLFSIALLVGCGTSAKITSSSVDSTITTKDLNGILVIAVTNQEPGHQQVRASFEDTFTQQLINKGVNAVSSHTVLAENSTKDQVLAVAKKLQLDTILVTRYAGTVTEDVYHQGNSYYAYAPVYYDDYNGGFGGYYGRIYKVYADPSVWTSNNYVTLISDLYETSTEKRIWEASSEAISSGDLESLRDAFISAFVDNMEKDHLFSR